MSNPPLDRDLFDQLAAAYRQRWAVPLVACRLDGVVLWADPAATPPAATDAERARAVAEALRWGEPAMMLTAADSLLWAVPLMLNAQPLAGLAAECAVPPPLEVTAAAADLLDRVVAANLTNAALLAAHRDTGRMEREQAEARHALATGSPYNLRRLFLLEEPLLAAAIRRGDRGAARAVLNRLLVGIHASAGESVDLVKSFYAELVVTVSRTAVWAGGAPEALLQANLSGLGRLSGITGDESLAHWLRAMLEQAMDAVHLARRQDEAATLAEAIAHLHEHFAEDLTRDQLARVACLSPAHFSRQVRRHFGLTFSQLLTRVRLEHATELLATTDRPVAEVARACGYHDPSYFARVFTRAKGSSPSDWRAAQR